MVKAEAKQIDYPKRYSGYFFASYSMGQCLGNTVFYLMLSTMSLEETAAFNHSLYLSNSSVCGKNDCQVANVTASRIENYNPLSQASQIIVASVSSCLILISAMLFFLFLPDPQHKTETRETLNNNDNESASLALLFMNSLKNIWSALKFTKIYLIILLPFYNGLNWTFIHSEMTRAFASCIFGLQYVSLSMMVYSALVGCSSYLFGKMASIKGGRYLFSLHFLPIYFCIQLVF